MSNTRVLTGITTTGTPHIGNYLGAIKPAIEATLNPNTNSFFFLADYHALIKCHDPERVAQSTREIAATWLALGLDTDKATFYRQTDIPEIPELTWILTCMCSKGLMNRAHAYKASVDANRDAGSEDLDDGITMGLFSYPILMAADILMFNAHKIPVGKDQIQHIEMARDIAGKFNHTYEELFALPEAQVDEETQLIPGLDGRKMSKSYDNTIPLFAPTDQLRKLINQIKTDLREPGEPKDADNSTIFQLYNLFANKDESATMRSAFENGIAWGEAKRELFEFLDAKLSAPRARYNELMNNLDAVEAELHKGAEKARAEAAPLLEKVRIAAGIRPLTYVAPKAEKQKAKQKELTAEELARIEEGRRRAILRGAQPLLDQVANAEYPAAEAKAIVAAKTEEVAGLKKKAKQKAENELEALKAEWASLLN
ncbi:MULTISPECIES: tryptophan--tRNA ligase [unclassified Marinobacterium]|jgi:tryptophanyl-tRNA synthetase|uniref:tryptophan--tRNA ligase n=1 Tax=unclassified Marinobacterium TaxID=2644139 RepID=UPI0015686A20|nr:MULTISPECIES: tryptophan--tRNA ligase [unclassified Marinobacterium]NRP09953.1 Tryptophan--tRNA ligase [Marinobacterium sp. xm-g-48]NRP26947.1 Tryptophan--tRNA ligase [Marinobacterium sp. xm-d-420]NRP57087.1 Tryptophan--tRNA ligase [Marinobacterium sp. xm-d-510]NRP93972.1 Tryptophan--tRNA ligase [Marinobacterium sp. xm-g-59]NRP97663.1 Tryptophan--tRNA ligase [Marinobacterium sp. xm-a-127]